MRKPRVLVAGYYNRNNQIIRNIEKYECEVEWTSVERSASFPKNADIVVLVQHLLNKDKQRRILDHYKGGADVILASLGFSDIRARFEKALEAATDRIVIESKNDSVAVGFGSTMKPALAVVRDQLKKSFNFEEVSKIVTDCLEAGMTYKNTAEYLNCDGWLPEEKSGKKEFDEWTVRQVIVDELKNQEKEDQQLELINKVLQMTTIPDKEKLEIIGKINRGEIKTVEWTETNVVSGVLCLRRRQLGKPDVVVEFTKAQAEVALLNVSAINDFLNKKG